MKKISNSHDNSFKIQIDDSSVEPVYAEGCTLYDRSTINDKSDNDVVSITYTFKKYVYIFVIRF